MDDLCWRRLEGSFFNSYSTFPWIAPLTLDMYLLMLRNKQGGIKYHFSWFLVWLNLGLNPDLPEYWLTLYHYANIYTCIYINTKHSSHDKNGRKAKSLRRLQMVGFKVFRVHLGLIITKDFSELLKHSRLGQ